jgi:predicted nucleotidyltransferase
MRAREQVNEYDLGLPVPLAPLEERRRAVPDAVWLRLAEAKRVAQAMLGDRLCAMRLFGSYARGQFDEDSDVDVLVLARSLEPGERGRVSDAVHAVSTSEAIVAPLVLTVDQLEDLRRRELILATDCDREGIPI